MKIIILVLMLVPFTPLYAQVPNDTNSIMTKMLYDCKGNSSVLCVNTISLVKSLCSESIYNVCTEPIFDSAINEEATNNISNNNPSIDNPKNNPILDSLKTLFGGMTNDNK